MGTGERERSKGGNWGVRERENGGREKKGGVGRIRGERKKNKMLMLT